MKVDGFWMMNLFVLARWRYLFGECLKGKVRLFVFVVHKRCGRGKRKDEGRGMGEEAVGGRRLDKGGRREKAGGRRKEA